MERYINEIIPRDGMTFWDIGLSNTEVVKEWDRLSNA